MAKGKNKVLTAVVSLAGSIDPSLGKAMEGLTDHLEKINLKAVAVTGAVGAVAVGTAKAVAEAGKYLTTLGNDYNKTMNQLSASTGATGEELAALGESVNDIYAKGLGEDFQDVADGMAAVQKASDLTGDALEEATAAGFTLRDTFGYDIPESAKAASALMKNFNITAEEAYGLIATGAQNGADKNGDLLDTLNEYSGQYAALGLSADQFLNSLIGGADAGLFSIDKIGDAVKEFNIRAKDGSDSSKEAFKALGLNANVMFEAFAAGGDSAQAAFFDTMDALNGLQDPLKKNEIGVALFGSQFEDLEAGVLPVLSDIETAAYDGAEALEQINAVKYNDLESAFEQIRRTAEVTLLPIASMMADAFTDMAPIISDVLEDLVPVVQDTLEECMPFVKEFLVGIGDTLKFVLPLIAKLAASLLPMLTSLVSSLLPPLLDLLNGALPPLIEIVQAVLPFLVSVLTQILPIITEIISAVLPVLLEIISALLPVLQPILDIVLQLCNDVVLPLLDPLLMLIEAILPPIMSLLEVLIPILKPVLAILQPIADVLGLIIGAIAKVVGWVADGLNWIVGLFTGETNEETVKAQGYATGGFTNGISIAGEDPRYPTEAVISFNPAYRDENLSYWAKAGQMLGATTGSNYEYLSGNSGTSVVYDLTGLSFSPQIKIQGDADEDTIIRKLRELEPEFIDFILEALNRREEGAYVTADSRLY